MPDVKRRQEGLTENHIKLIKDILKESCVGAACIKRCEVYEKLKELTAVDMELYRFEREITVALRDGRITGYETKPGRFGGICRAGAFKKIHHHVLIGDRAVHVGHLDIQGLIERVLGGKENDQGNIRLGGKQYLLPKTIHAERLLEALLNFLNKGNK